MSVCSTTKWLGDISIKDILGKKALLKENRSIGKYKCLVIFLVIF